MESNIKQTQIQLRFLIVIGFIVSGLVLITNLLMLAYDLPGFLSGWGKPFGTLGLIFSSNTALAALIVALSMAARRYMRDVMLSRHQLDQKQ